MEHSRVVHLAHTLPAQSVAGRPQGHASQPPEHMAPPPTSHSELSAHSFLPLPQYLGLFLVLDLRGSCLPLFPELGSPLALEILVSSPGIQALLAFTAGQGRGGEERRKPQGDLGTRGPCLIFPFEWSRHLENTSYPTNQG